MKPAVLVTIPTSNYCEKARWALDRARLPFEERGHLPFFSRLATWRWGRWSSVPILRTDDEIVADSTDILHWVDAHGPREGRLYPPPEDAEGRRTVEELEERFDRGIGKATRILMLSHVLPNRKLTIRLARAGVPAAEWVGLAASLPLARLGVRRLYGITPATAAGARELLDREMTDVGRMLADGRRYLTGDRFTAADLTLASLAGPLVLPEKAGGLPALDDLPAEGRADVERYRATPAGRYVRRLYAEER